MSVDGSGALEMTATPAKTVVAPVCVNSWLTTVRFPVVGSIDNSDPVLILSARIAPVEDTPIERVSRAGPVPIDGSPLVSGDADTTVLSPVVVLMR